MITIKNLHASIGDKEILRGINLEVKAGEVHAIMGPNGSGKSTLSSVLAGREVYDVTEGEVTFNGKNLLDLSPEDRAREGLFLAFQYPVEIPGVSNVNFLRTALNEIRAYHGQEEMPAKDFLALVKDKSKYDNLKNRFIVFFNAHIPEFDEKLVDVDVGVLQLENYPHLIERICRTWGGGEIIPILESLLVDDREGKRTGFELPVYRDILLLISIANELEKMRAIDGSKSNLRSRFQEQQATAENTESSKNENKLNAIEFEVIDFPKNAS